MILHYVMMIAQCFLFDHLFIFIGFNINIIDTWRKHLKACLCRNFKVLQVSYLYEPFEVERTDVGIFFIMEWCANREIGRVHGNYYGGSYPPERLKCGSRWKRKILLILSSLHLRQFCFSREMCYLGTKRGLTTLYLFLFQKIQEKVASSLHCGAYRTVLFHHPLIFHITNSLVTSKDRSAPILPLSCSLSLIYKRCVA